MCPWVMQLCDPFDDRLDLFFKLKACFLIFVEYLIVVSLFDWIYTYGVGNVGEE
jgi:hypothetical protein